MSNKQLLIGIGASVVALLVFVGVVIVGWQTYYNLDAIAQIEPTATPTAIPATKESEAVTSATDTPVASAPTDTPAPLAEPHAGSMTETALLNAILPERDQRLLAMRLKHHGQEIPLVVSDTPPNYQLGDETTFWVTDNQQSPPHVFEATASLQYITAHSYWWVENSFNVPASDLKRSAEAFEQKTYPTDRAFFGSEWSPGIDGDERVHVYMGNVPGVAGYYAAANSYASQAETYSNEREMFFINLGAIRPGSSQFDGTLAHEFQHMIHWNQDRNEDTWVNEGLSELATFLNGHGPSNFMGSFLSRPDTQLTSWSTTSDTTTNYGLSFLFMAYFLEHYGEDTMKAVVAHPNNGMAGFNAVLTERGFTEQFDDIFADFLIANYLQDATIGDGAWGYTGLSPSSVTTAQRHQSYPVEQNDQVHQYGADYIELYPDGEALTIEFTGDTEARLLDNQAYSGDYQWYGHRGDDSNTHLTRAVDLSGVEQATLQFWSWYDIEPDWDYAYVEVSADGGESWHVLETAHTTTDNPSGNAYGAAFTGSSNGFWQENQADLSPYTGGEVLIRFEYVTDDAVNHPGFALDDISIPEIDFSDDVENGSNNWQAEGFIRMDNRLPQRFLVQLIQIDDEVIVQSMPLDDDNHGQLTIDTSNGEIEQVIMVISALAPVTTEPATYRYKIGSE
ncbi:immune inhibitor A [Anaerolineales bacterium HSG6]|nr:immune inhibitor A [Anaerolineales bacterium HSG6]